jgi:hypothetical protein
MGDIPALQAAVDAAKSALAAKPDDAALAAAVDDAVKALADAQADTQAAVSKKGGKQTEARVLVATAGYEANAIIAGAEADDAVAGGWADKTPAAVAYAKSLA